MNTTTSSIIALDMIPDPENNQVFIFQQKDIQQVVYIDEDELDIELGLDFGDYYDGDYDEYDEEDYEEDEYENEIIQQLETSAVYRCPGG